MKAVAPKNTESEINDSRKYQSDFEPMTRHGRQSSPRSFLSMVSSLSGLFSSLGVFSSPNMAHRIWDILRTAMVLCRLSRDVMKRVYVAGDKKPLGPRFGDEKRPLGL